MNPIRIIPVALAAAWSLAGCGLFDDPTPQNIFLKIQGPAGAPVELHLSADFVAGVDEIGVTRVQVFSSDTVRMVLPVDTVIDISVEQRFFVQAQPAAADSLDVRVTIDVDSRSLFERSGGLLLASPFLYVYVFNQPTTVNIELL